MRARVAAALGAVAAVCALAAPAAQATDGPVCSLRVAGGPLGFERNFVVGRVEGTDFAVGTAQCVYDVQRSYSGTLTVSVQSDAGGGWTDVPGCTAQATASTTDSVLVFDALPVTCVHPGAEGDHDDRAYARLTTSASFDVHETTSPAWPMPAG